MNEQKPQNQLIKAKRDIRDMITSDTAKAQMASVLPKHLTPDRMARVVLTAILKTPKLLDCLPESLMQAMMLCSQAGLEPDGRLAHLIPYGNIVQVIFDYKGLVTLALRNGMDMVYGDKVCEADVFDAYVENGDKVLKHRPDFRKARGEAICYYAVTKRAGNPDWEVMSKEEVDDIRKRSKMANSGPWVTDYNEMAKKTVLRRMSKRWDLLPEIADVINRDDDVPEPIKPVMAKPVWDGPDATKAITGPVPESQEESSGSAEPEQSSQKSEVPSVNYVKAVRNLCKLSRITEGALLDFLTSTGSTDGSVSTLEELAMYEGGSVIKLARDQWSGDNGIAETIKAVKGGTQ